MTRRPDIAIFGAGAWGTALAMAWARQGAQVALWGHPRELVDTLALKRRHPALGEAELPASVRPLAEPGEAFGAHLWISALPTQVNPSVWAGLAAQTAQRPELLIHVSKGIIQGTHQRVTEVLEPLLLVPVGVLSGPTFADEVARDLPTAILLALPATVADERAGELQALLATPNLRVYLSRDVPGVELCGAFKNILAIAAGLVESLGLGNNARAALITRGLAGMGDLLRTATGAQSRNRRFGALLGQGLSPAAATLALGDSVVEGAFTTEAALGMAQRMGLELPITAEVGRLLQGADPLEAVKRLMQRSLKPE